MSSYDYKEETEHRRELMERFEKKRQRGASARQFLVTFLKVTGVCFLVAAAIVGTIVLVKGMKDRRQNQVALNSEQRSEAKSIAVSEVDSSVKSLETEIASEESRQMIEVGDVQFVTGYEAVETDATIQIPEMSETEENYIDSKYVVLINENTGEITAEKEAKTIINPASMTKIMTLLVAADHLTEEDLSKKVKISAEISDYVYRNECSNAGFEVDEKIPVKDLLYGTILPSGADAALALADYVAGSHEEFVELMNQKLAELGLSETAHFTNCIGLYDEDHYCSVYDMAMILKAAVEKDLCREVLSAHTYTTSKTKKHKEGITLSNWFLRRIEDHPCGGLVLCAKTGYVSQAGNCCASYEITDNGTPYICVTGKAAGGWRCIFDHVAIYNRYAK